MIEKLEQILLFLCFYYFNAAIFKLIDVFIKASSYALQKQPTVNAVIDGQEIIYRDFVDISVAVATPKVGNEWRN